MKAPDKIVIFPDDYPTLWYMPDGWETVPSGNVEYIRKDALLEWLSDMKFMANSERAGAYQNVIDKLNEM